jgi:Zn-dependent peptidase ImmA (M78 family)
MLTPLGKALRQLRIDKGLKLLDVAEALGVSSAYVSAIETGRKAVPDGFVADLRRKLKLTAAEADVLRRAVDRTRKTVSVDALAGEQREMVARFARQIDELPEGLLKKLKTELKSLSSEHPFARKRAGIVVKPMSADNIRKFAEKVRSAFIEEDQVRFPIMEVLDPLLSTVIEEFYLDIRTKEEMGELEGAVVSGSGVLCLRQDVYEDACRGNGRARFTAAHEFAHYLMHRDVTMARVRDDSVPIFCDSEWQADTFAGALMMSRRHLDQFDGCAEQAATACGMSPAAARYQLNLYGRSPT